ncbi:MAG: hypothetical protein ACPLZF_06585 [Nitrososphaeria archaeon]
MWHTREVIKYFIVSTILIQIIFSSAYIEEVDSGEERIQFRKIDLSIKFEP